MSRAALALVVLAAAVTGCAADPREGYSFASTYSTEITTIAIPVFDNTTYDHGLERLLTDALVKEVERSTPWSVAPRSSADTILTGVITDAELRRLSTNRDTGLVQEMVVDLAVSFEWRDARTGELLAAWRNFRAASSFVPSREAGERIGVGQRGAIDQMAGDIVAALRSSW